MTEEVEIVMPGLSARHESYGKFVQIDTYYDEKGGWLLGIIDEFINSTLWDDSFSMGQEALAEALNTIKKEGAGSLMSSLSRGALNWTV